MVLVLILLSDPKKLELVNVKKEVLVLPGVSKGRVKISRYLKRFYKLKKPGDLFKK